LAALAFGFFCDVDLASFFADRCRIEGCFGGSDAADVARAIAATSNQILRRR
jgi:hypothetical protein